MKLHEVDLCGQHLYLCLNGQALFDIYDKFGTKGFITDPLKDNNKAGFDEFPVLEPGDNSISWTGTVTKVEIVPRWRCL